MLDEDLRGTKMVVVETFDNNCHVFSLINDNEQYFLQHEQSSRLITKLVIKPDLWVFYKDGGYEHGVKLLKPLNSIEDKVLAMNFDIDPDIFDILINSGLISYSKSMADLYDLNVAYSRDIKYHRNDYKRKDSKQLALSKMRLGNFN